MEEISKKKMKEISKKLKKSHITEQELYIFLEHGKESKQIHDFRNAWKVSFADLQKIARL